MRNDKTHQRTGELLDVRAAPQAAEERVPAWEMVEAGRYMPRRIRGSFRGRELG